MQRAIRVTLLASMFLLSACQTKPEPEVREAERIATIYMHSLPAGCMVELNGEFIGVTPLEFKTPATDDGEWPGWQKVYNLRASIPLGQGYEQKSWYSGERIPTRVVFRIPGAERWYSATQAQPPPSGIRIR
jgi:hypothetical protein